MSKHNKRVTINDRLARRAHQVDPTRSELLAKVLGESSSITLNDGTKKLSAKQALEAHQELLELIVQLRQTETNLTPKLPVRDELSWKRFFQWVDSELGPERKLSERIGVVQQSKSAIDNPCNNLHEHALIAKVPIKQGEQVFTIKRSLMLSTESVMKDYDLIEFVKKDPIASGMPNVVLALHLLNEYSKGERSYWYPYLSILPSKISPVLELNKLKCLSASTHLFEALKMIRAVARQYSYFFKSLQSTHLPLCKDFTFDYYCWGVSMVSSRQNEIPPSNRKTALGPVVHALIPVLDMCNHDQTSNQAIFEDGQSHLCAHQNLDVNDEITINYGCRSSGDFYIHNGFVPKEVQYDIVPFNISLDKSNSLYGSKLKLLKTLNMLPHGRFRLTYNNHENRHKRDPHLTMFLIVYFLNEEELEFILRSDNPVGIADEIYEYVQYNQLTPSNTTWPLMDSEAEVKEEHKLKIRAMKERLAESIKEYLSLRASIGIALIDRALKENQELDSSMSQLLTHEKSIYQSYLINKLQC